MVAGWVHAVLDPLGLWGVFGFAFFDSAFIPIIPLDVMIAGYINQYREQFWWPILLGAIGSTLGGTVIWAIGRVGGEPLLARRFGEEKLEFFRNKFEKLEFVVIALPAAIPIPGTPYKPIQLAAGVFGMHIGLFMAAVFAGRIVRFSILAVAVIFGRGLVMYHLRPSLAVLAALGVLYLLYRHLKRRKARPPVLRESND